MNDFEELNKAYQQMIKGQPLPVRSCVEVAAFVSGAEG